MTMWIVVTGLLLLWIVVTSSDNGDYMDCGYWIVVTTDCGDFVRTLVTMWIVVTGLL